jgi:hypothetical protein
MQMIKLRNYIKLEKNLSVQVNEFIIGKALGWILQLLKHWLLDHYWKKDMELD